MNGTVHVASWWWVDDFISVRRFRKRYIACIDIISYHIIPPHISPFVPLAIKIYILYLDRSNERRLKQAGRALPSIIIHHLES